MLNAMDISTSALTAQRVRMDVIAGNMANAFSTHQEDGTIEPYRRRIVALSSQPIDGAGTGVSVDGVAHCAVVGKSPESVQSPVMQCLITSENLMSFAPVEIRTTSGMREPTSAYDRMVAEGRITPAIGSFDDMPPPLGPLGTAGTDALAADREGKE